MRVDEVMQTDLLTMRGTDTVGSAVTLLAQSHISGVPVVDDHGRLAGVLSSTDILGALAEHSEPDARESVFEDTLVQEIMTPRPETITPEASVKDAAQRMVYLEIHRIFVEDAGRLVGVVSTTDLVRALAKSRV